MFAWYSERTEEDSRAGTRRGVNTCPAPTPRTPTRVPETESQLWPSVRYLRGDQTSQDCVNPKQLSA